MKNLIAKVVLALMCAGSFAAISSEAQAYYYYHNGYHRYYYGHPYYRTYYRAYPRYYGRRCVGGYWRNHVWHPRRCW
jgi:hypothetical protein